MRSGPNLWAFGLTVLLPAMAIAAPYDGTYRQAANAECGLVGADGAAVRINEGIFYGVDMECLMTRPVDVNEMDAVLYTMQCTGPADQWTDRVMIMNSAEDDGIYMIWNGYVFRYSRCPEAETSPAASE